MGWLWKLTGGRPMRAEGYAFTDRVSGRGVYRFIDRLGRAWLAEGSWDLFRVERGSAAAAMAPAKESE